MPLLIRNGRIITAHDDVVADIYCANETITRIEPDIDRNSLAPDTEVIDATGKYVFPGFIDPHVHIHLPFMGTHAKDDWTSASMAALAGGTTTLIEMICPGPTDEPLDAFAAWRDHADGNASVDYSFHMGVVRFDEAARPQFRRIIEEFGIPSVKVFLAYKGALNLPDAHLFDVMMLARDCGAMVTAHCENADAIDAMQRRLIAAGKTGPEWHERSRPTIVEAEGVHHLTTFAELTGAHVYCVHTSCDEALRTAVNARQRGVNVWVEAVAPHLVLDAEYAERPDVEGAKYVMSPPLRAKWHQEMLWHGVRSRMISTIGTDHAPFDTASQKIMGRDDFTKIPNGIPSVQERIDLVHTHGVCGRQIDLHTMVDACSTQAAKLFGMYPRKGTIRVGSDADIVVYDPHYTDTFSVERSFSQVDYNAFEGWPVQGRSEVVTVRGEVQCRDGGFVGTIGRGQLIERDATHA
ncbi:MAG: dihydropyrimidinase [Planctomycetota bacterium]